MFSQKEIKKITILPPLHLETSVDLLRKSSFNDNWIQWAAANMFNQFTVCSLSVVLCFYDIF